MNDPLDALKDHDCPLCIEVWRSLDEAVKLGHQVSAAVFKEPPETAEDAEQHVLGAICSWWVAHSLVVTKGNPQGLLHCLCNAFAEHGLHISPKEMQPS